MRWVIRALLTSFLCACSHSELSGPEFSDFAVSDQFPVNWTCHAEAEGGFFESESTGHYYFYKDGSFRIKGAKSESYGQSQVIFFHWHTTGKWEWQGTDVKLLINESRLGGYTTTTENSDTVDAYADLLRQKWASFSGIERVIEVLSLDEQNMIFFDPLISEDKEVHCRHLPPRPVVI